MPDSNSRTDTTMLYDTHAHFFTSDIERYPIDTRGAREAADELRERILANPSTPEVILKAWDKTRVWGGAGVQYTSAYKTDNSYVMDVSDDHPDRISAVVILNARDPETPARIRDFVTNRGVTGLRLTGFPAEDGSWPWLDSGAALDTWAEADRLGLAVVLMYLPSRNSDDALEHIGRLAERFPNTKIVLDHIGWPALSGAPDYGITPAHLAVGKFPNVYFKLTTNNLYKMRDSGVPADEFLRHIVDLWGAERIMWGSDYGNTVGTFEEMVEGALASTALLNEAERRQVLLETGRTLFARTKMP